MIAESCECVALEVASSPQRIKLDSSCHQGGQPLGRLVHAMVLTGLAVLVLFFLKPDSMFDPSTGRPRQWGLRRGQTLLSVGAATFLTAAFTLFVFTWIDMVFAP